MPTETVNDSVRVAIASLLKLINLMGAELLVGKHRDDIDEFERNVRAKLYAHLPDASPGDTASGVALAHAMVEPVLADLRERVRRMQCGEPTPLAHVEGFG
jgi:hypothetical protein